MASFVEPETNAAIVVLHDTFARKQCGLNRNKRAYFARCGDGKKDGCLATKDSPDISADPKHKAPSEQWLDMIDGMPWFSQRLFPCPDSQAGGHFVC